MSCQATKIDLSQLFGTQLQRSFELDAEDEVQRDVLIGRCQRMSNNKKSQLLMVKMVKIHVN
jgi:hypothetical protein